ncbi:MAG: outer membrane protein transport protein [Deltaproteobacteria bacterium]|nr:outer membrane protein transport protein [Deltaproteobacteria bacterium]
MVLAVLAFAPAHAQVGRFDVAISSAPSPVGAGARATGVGSAFIALADDATAASWNPGGLVQLERPEISAVGLGVYETDHVPRNVTETADLLEDDRVGRSDVGAAHLDYLSVAVPFSWGGRNVIASLNYQQTFSFDREFSLHYEQTRPESFSTADGTFEQGGALYALSPAFAAEVLPELSLGVAVNFWMDGIGRAVAWDSRLDVHNTLDFAGEHSESQSTFKTRNDLFDGTNATFGVLWRATEVLRVGSVVKLPFQAGFRNVTTAFDSGVQTGERRARLRMELPLQVGLGVAVQPTDELRVSVDVTHVRWDEFRLSDSQGNEYLISGDPVDPANPLYPSDGPPGGYHADPVTTVRAGGEYLLRLSEGVIALRLGAFHDPEPSRGAPEDCYGGSIGFGFTWDRASIDLAYQLRTGQNLDGVAVLNNVLAQPENAIDVTQHNLYVSTVAYF